MNNLLNIAIETTKKNIVKVSKKESVNDSLIEILYNQKLKLTRIELVAHISLRRLILEHGEDKLNEMKQEELKALLKKTNKTVKNGLDTSISNSQNNSSFSYNPKYDDYKLELKGDKFQITKVK